MKCSQRTSPPKKFIMQMKEMVVINKDIVGKYQSGLIDAAIMKNKDKAAQTYET